MAGDLRIEVVVRPLLAHRSVNASRQHLAVQQRAPVVDLEPQLATLVESTPEGNDWLHELKYDGYRILALVAGAKVRLISRNGNDWTARFAPIRQAVARLHARTAVLDGEVTVLLPDGRTSFQALQNVFRDQPQAGAVVYFAFDLLEINGEDLRRLPLERRKARLRSLLLSTDQSELRFSDHVIGHGRETFARACRAGNEGLVSKRRDAPYQPGRGRGWVKTKCRRRQEFVIGGFTEPQGSRLGLGALLLGVYDDGRLVYCGKVGTGFTQTVATDLRAQLQRLEQPECGFEPRPRRDVAGAHWVHPELVGEVEFTEWTNDGRIRHPSFKGLRADKDPGEVVREFESDQPLLRPRIRAATQGRASARRTTR